jgi:hypothetical protein
MLGKIKRIQVNEPESEQRQQKVPFDIKIRIGGMIPNFSPPNQDFTRLADAELLKRIDSPLDEVIVDEIRISSGSFTIITPYTGNSRDFSEAGILGGTYSSQKDDHEKK